MAVAPGDRGRLGALQADRRQVRLDGLLLVGLEQPFRRAAVGEERREALEHRRRGRGVHPVVDPHLGGPGATVVVEHRVHRAQPVDRTAPQVPGAPGEHRVGDPVRPLRVLAGVLELGERVGHPAADRREVRGRLGRQAPERGHDLARVAAGGVQAPGDGLGEVGDVALRRQLHRGREHLAGAFAAGRGLGGEQGAELGELLGGQRGLDREVGCRARRRRPASRPARGRRARDGRPRCGCRSCRARGRAAPRSRPRARRPGRPARRRGPRAGRRGARRARRSCGRPRRGRTRCCAPRDPRCPRRARGRRRRDPRPARCTGRASPAAACRAAPAGPAPSRWSRARGGPRRAARRAGSRSCGSCRCPAAPRRRPPSRDPAC